MTLDNILCMGGRVERKRKKERRELLWWYFGGYLEEFLTVGITICLFFFPLGKNLHMT